MRGLVVVLYLCSSGILSSNHKASLHWLSLYTHAKPHWMDAANHTLHKKYTVSIPLDPWGSGGDNDQTPPNFRVESGVQDYPCAIWVAIYSIMLYISIHLLTFIWYIQWGWDSDHMPSVTQSLPQPTWRTQDQQELLIMYEEEGWLDYSTHNFTSTSEYFPSKNFSQPRKNLGQARASLFHRHCPSKHYRKAS